MWNFRPAPARWRRSSGPVALTLVLPAAQEFAAVAAGQRGAGHASRCARRPIPPPSRCSKAAGRPVAAPAPICPARSPPPPPRMSPTAWAARWISFWMRAAPPLGIESTVIGFDGDRPLLLRPGAVAREEIEDLVGPLGPPRQPDPVAGPTGKPLCAARRLAPERRARSNPAKCCWASAMRRAPS